MKSNPFILQMNKFIMTFILMLFSVQVFGQVTNVDCSNGQCVMSCGSLNPTCTGSVFTVNPTTKNCAGYDCVVGDIFSTISSSGFNTEAVNVTSDLVLKPQNLKMSIQNGASPGQDLTVNLNAKSQAWDYAASFTLFTDNLNQVSINLNGYSGKKGKDSSEICADKIKNGDYGAAVQTFFNTRRASDPQINKDRCDLQDLNYMQQFSFSCDDPSYNEISPSNPTVSVQRIKSRARCNAVGSYSDCVKKKVRVNCNYALWSTVKNRFFQYDDATYSSWVGTKTSNADNYTGSGQYLSSTTSYQLCGTGQHDTCQSNPFGSTTYSLYSGSPNSCSPYGQIAHSYSAYNLLSAADKAACNVVQSSSNSLYTGTVSYYKPVTVYNSKRTLFNLNRTGSSIGPYNESFVDTEVARLGGINGFCQAYGVSASVNADPSGFFGGVPGYAAAQSGISQTPGGFGAAFTGYYDSAGIPWESTNVNTNPNWQADTSAQHPLTCFSRNELNPAYDPVAAAASCGYYGCFYFVPQYISVTHCRAAIWKAVSGSSVSYTPEVYLDPQAPNNDHWEKLSTSMFNTCPSDYKLVKNNYVTLTEYADSPALCSSATSPQDPNNLAQWQYTGMSQETIHGVESVSCSIGSCAVNSSVSDLDRNIDVIIPGDGEDGTEQGRGLIFAYNIKNLTKTALAGDAGTKGAADVSISSQVRICAKIDDATAGINTAQAKNPFVSFRRYNWQSVKSNNAGNNGVPPRQNGKKVEVFKKLDPGLRYFLEKSLN
jgi:hypothetical protein